MYACVHSLCRCVQRNAQKINETNISPNHTVGQAMDERKCMYAWLKYACVCAVCVCARARVRVRVFLYVGVAVCAVVLVYVCVLVVDFNAFALKFILWYAPRLSPVNICPPPFRLPQGHHRVHESIHRVRESIPATDMLANKNSSKKTLEWQFWMCIWFYFFFIFFYK